MMTVECSLVRIYDATRPRLRFSNYAHLSHSVPIGLVSELTAMIQRDFKAE